MKPLSRLRKPVSAIVLALAVLALFWPVRGYEFLRYDDGEYVTRNPQVKAGLTWPGFIWAFRTTHAANWHPLTWLSHMLDVELFGLNAGRHHLMNSFLHAANAILLFLLLANMTGAVWRSLLAAALFALHPLHVESVAWVAERKDVLSTIFWLLTMMAYLRYTRQPGPARYAPVCLLFALGLMAKPMLVTLPFVLLLLDYWPLGRLAGPAPLPRSAPFPARIIAEKVPLIAMSAASSLITYLAQTGGGAAPSLENYPLKIRAANALVSSMAYVMKMVWPSGLAVFYPYHLGRLRIPMVVLSGLGLCLLIILAVSGARRRPYGLVGMAWYLGTLLPVIGLVQVGGQAMADRYTYVTLIGLFVALAWLWGDLVSLKPRWTVPLWSGATAALLLLAVCSRYQLNFWRDTGRLFNRALAVTEGNYMAHEVLAAVLVDQGKTEEALEHYEQAQQIAQRAEDYQQNGQLLIRMGRYEEAEGKLRRALAIKPGLAAAYVNLGYVYSAQGRWDEAMGVYQEALRLDPKNPTVYFNIGSLLARQGKYEESGPFYIRALEIDPMNAEARNNLGYAFEMQGRYAEAVTHLREAVRLNPADGRANTNLGNALMKAGEAAEARRYIAEGARLSMAKEKPE